MPRKPKTQPEENKKVFPDVSPFGESVMIPSGCTILDLCCTDTVDGFCPAGHCVNIIGDRNSGKTLLAVASMAETYRRYGDSFRYIFFDLENAYSFDTPKLFGNKFAEALCVIPVPPSEEWATEHLAKKMCELIDKDKRPCYIVIDSMDAMRPIKEYTGFDDIADGKGGIDSRGKANNLFFRVVVPKISETGSFMIYLSQARDMIGVAAFYKAKTRSGGKALGYNAYVELWLSCGRTIEIDDLKIGGWTYAKVERSKANGKKRLCEFPILPAYGIDDTLACLTWLNKEAGRVSINRGVWDLNKIGIDYIGKDPCLFIETEGKEDEIRNIVRNIWDERERELVTATFGGRKNRYE